MRKLSVEKSVFDKAEQKDKKMENTFVRKLFLIFFEVWLNPAQNNSIQLSDSICVWCVRGWFKDRVAQGMVEGR